MRNCPVLIAVLLLCVVFSFRALESPVPSASLRAAPPQIQTSVGKKPLPPWRIPT